MLGVKTVKLETCGSCGGCLFSFSQTDLEFLCFLFMGSHTTWLQQRDWAGKAYYLPAKCSFPLTS